MIRAWKRSIHFATLLLGLSAACGAPIQLHPAFNPGSGANSSVKGVATDGGGSIWLAGNFTTVNEVSRSGVAKLDSNGLVDPSFTTPLAVNAAVRVVPLDGGKLLVGCSSVGTGTDFRQGIVRLHANGVIDTTFNAGSAINSNVNTIEVLAGGKILIGGSFSKGIAKLNPDGSADPDFTPGTGLNGSVSAIRVLPSGKILVGGSFSSVNGLSRNNLCRLNANGTPDSSFNPTGPGPDSSVYDIEVQPDGQVLVAGGFYTFNDLNIRSLARLTADGVPDPNFVPTPSSSVEALTLLADGRILIGGNFTTIGTVSCRRIALLHADGKPDPSFETTSGASSMVSAIQLLSDGNILLGGSFSTVATVASKSFAKLVGPGNATRAAVASIQPRSGEVGAVIQLRGSNFSNLTSIEFGGSVPALFTALSETEATVTVPAGALPGPLTLKTPHGDSSSLNAFYPLPVPPGTLDPSFDVGTGASSTVRALAKDPLGRVILAGDFSTVNGFSKVGIARLSPDGSVDASFIPPSTSSSLRLTAIQPDGKILVGGYSIGSKSGIARLNPNGSVDDSFTASGVANVYAIALQADGKILVGGNFTRRIARLHPDGTVDLTFNVGTGASSDVNAIRVQPDGRILVGGYFSTFNGIASKYIVRLTDSGGIDPTFQVTGSGVSGEVKALALQADGRIVIGGGFSSINGKSEFKYLARLGPNGALDESFKPLPSATVHAAEITPDGRIAIGGDFTAINGIARNYAALLHADGAVVAGFNTAGGPSFAVYAVLPGASGDLLIGGNFLTISGQPPQAIARLAGDQGKTRPTITGISPDTGVAGDRLTISGSNLAGLTRAEFSGGISATIFPISAVLAEVEVPAGAMSGPIRVRNAQGETTSSATFKLLSKPAPLITGIPAGSVAIGSTCTVTGKNFYDVASVRIGVLSATYVVISATEMTVTVPANALTGRVILSGPGGSTESATYLTVVKAAPVFTSAATTTGRVGKPFTFTLKAANNPTGFTAGPIPAGLQLNGLTGVISGIPTAAGVSSVPITATNEGGTTSGSLAINISLPLPPVLASVSPSQIATGGKFIVVGEFLFQTTAVTVGGVAASFEILSDNRLAIVMPAGVESGLVQVTTLQGSISSTASVNRWNFQAGSQTVTGFGDNSSSQRTPPVGLNDVTAVAAGQSHSLALRADGSVTGWGANWAGQAIPPSTVLPAIAITAGGHHSLALQADGSVAAWGRNDEAQCSGASGLTNIAAISAGGFHSLALTRLGTVKAWGADTSGQIAVPAGLAGVVAIAAGGNFSVALKSDGSVTAWGDNALGQTDVPASATDVVAITAGMAHVIALKSDGTLIGWGANWTGQINLPATASPITRISAGSYHTIALRADGSCVAWGANWSDQATLTPTTTAVAVAAGGDHSLILQAASPVPQVTTPLVASGKPGQAFILTPVTANGPSTFTAEGLAAGLAIDPLTGSITGTPTRGGDSIVTLTARNGFGISRQNLRLLIGPYLIGWGTSVPGPIPQTLANVVRVAAGTNHCLALLNNGTVSGWGNNSYGQTTIPAGLTNIVAIAAGESFSLALKSDGSVYGWGRNPVYPYTWTTPLATNVVAIDANGANAAALLNTGAAKILVSEYGSLATIGTDFIAIASTPSNSYSYLSNSATALNRSGYLVNSAGSGISTAGNFDAMALSSMGSDFSSEASPSWGIQRGGKLYEFQSSRYSAGTITQVLRTETSTATEIAAGIGFALVLNADATATTLAANPDPNFPSSYVAHPQLTTDTLVNLGAIAARESYALAVKDSTPRARFTSLRVAEGRVGQAFTHRLATSATPVSFSASLLPAGLTINATTGVISGTPPTAGTFNLLAVARFTSYFTTQLVSLKFTSGTAPVDLALTGSIVAEDLPVNSAVGTLAAIDYSPADTFTYSLVSGPGSTDNSKFKVAGNQLLTNAVLDYEAKQQLSIRIQVTDSGRNTFAKVFAITLTNAFTDDDDQDGLSQSEESQLGTDPALRDTDQDGASDGQENTGGSNPLSAAAKPTHYVAAWGLNTNGQCNVPRNLGPVIAVAAGDYHTLALRADGTIAAWGQNSSGQCDVPVGLRDVIAVAAGYAHSVALKLDGTVVAWGSSSYSVPAGLTDVIEISAGDYLTAALKSDGQVVVWGSTSSDATVVPSAAQGTVQLAAGYGHILALNQAGNTVGWGNDWQGQISDPQARTDLVALAAGNNLSLGLTPDGQVHAWGWNAYEATKVPAGLDSVVRISAGSYSALATRSDGSLVAWGNNSNLQSAVPPGLGPVQMADGGYGHSVALVAAAPPEYFLSSSIQSVVGLPVSRQLSFSGTADRFSARFLPPGLIFDPLTATLAGTPTRQGTYNVRFTAEKGFSRITRIITIHCGNPRRFEEWQAARLPGGAPSSHPLADPDGDSVSNLLEYALHRDPQVRETGSPVATSIADQSGQRYLTLTYERNKDATDLRCLIEVSGDLATWQSGPPATAVVSIIDHGDTETITVRDATPVSSSQPRFIRLKVEQLATD